jgi:large subunit ribosomal protein L23
MTTDLHVYEIVKRPLINEKTYQMSQVYNQYTFEVDMRANKIQIADAVMKLFDVDVMSVRTMVMPAKRGHRGRRVYTRKLAWKKAIVTLPQGQTIEAFNL